MYLRTASTIEDVVNYGVMPAIELMNVAEDLEDAGEDDRADMIHVEVKGKLFEIKQALKRIGG